jgi:hypothetical protein
LSGRDSLAVLHRKRHRPQYSRLSYLKATGLEKEPQSPLFPASIGKTGNWIPVILYARSASQIEEQAKYLGAFGATSDLDKLLDLTIDAINTR